MEGDSSKQPPPPSSPPAGAASPRPPNIELRIGEDGEPLQFAANEGSALIEVDSALDDDDCMSLNFPGSRSSTLGSFPSETAFDFTWEHGRRYHSAWTATVYGMPNDDKEIERLDFMNAILQRVVGDHLCLAPADFSRMRRALDLATGTGVWAIEFAEKYPHVEVIGNDISPIQPQYACPNVRFDVDDVESKWVYDEPFDFIFCRQLMICIQDWPRLVGQIRDNLAPGGWAEFQDFDLTPRSDDGSVHPNDEISTWENLMMDATRKLGREPSPGPMLEQWVREAGFVNITHKVFKVPCGIWPKSPGLKILGGYFAENILDGLEGFSMRFMCTVHGWREKDVHALLAGVRERLLSRHWHGFWHYHVVYAQRAS